MKEFFRVVEDLNVIYDGISTKERAISLAKIAHNSKLNNYHSVYRVDANGIYGCYQLKPGDSPETPIEKKYRVIISPWDDSQPRPTCLEEALKQYDEKKKHYHGTRIVEVVIQDGLIYDRKVDVRELKKSRKERCTNI